MATPTTTEAPKGKKKGPKKEKKNIPHALATVLASFNNTIVSITDAQGNVLAWSSAGRIGFKGSRKATPFAAQLAAGNAAQIAQEHGVRSLDVKVNGPGAGARAPSGPWPRRESTSGPSRTRRRFRTTGVVPVRGEGSNGSLPRFRLPAVPARRNEAVPQGGPLLHEQVRHRAPQLSSRPARQAPVEDPRLRHPAA